MAMSESAADSSGEPTHPREWILAEIARRTEAEPESDQGVEAVLWTSRDRLVKHAGKFSTPVKRKPVETELSKLIEQREVLYWHGHLTLATVPYLNAVAQSEQVCSVTRSILVDKCRDWLSAKANDQAGAEDSNGVGRDE